MRFGREVQVGAKNLGGNSMEMVFQVLGQEMMRKGVSMSRKKTRSGLRALTTPVSVGDRGS